MKTKQSFQFSLHFGKKTTKIQILPTAVGMALNFGRHSHRSKIFGYSCALWPLVQPWNICHSYSKIHVSEIYVFINFRFLPSSPLEVVQILLLISNGFMVFMPQILRLHQTSSYQNSSTYSCSSLCQ